MDLTPEPTPNIRQLLAFYLEAGVDCALAEEPVDRLSEPDAPIAPAPVRDTAPPRPIREMPAATPAVPRSEMALAPEAAIAIAREAARTAPTLEALRALLENFEGCALKNTATRLVFADGNPQARIMFVGEAPGRDEDIEGLPFVGRSGKLLDRMMAAIGLDRSSVYIANIVPWRPPGNRTQTLLGTKEGITKSRGRWFPFHTGKREIRAIPTYHPAFLLRSPLQKRLAWRDFLAIKKELAKPSGR